LYYENNIAALVYLLQELQQKDAASFIFSSSCTVYGQAEKMPITEDAPVQQPMSLPLPLLDYFQVWRVRIKYLM
jgi:UDP-glucose 4-epimerase